MEYRQRDDEMEFWHRGTTKEMIIMERDDQRNGSYGKGRS
jgi:hypothetical protein